MRVLQAVTLVSPDGAYGGPTRVAINQCVALKELGHDVTLLAGSRGYTSPPTQIMGVETHLFPVAQIVPGAGFAGIWSPQSIAWLRGHHHRFDVVHAHLARDLVTMPLAAISLAREKPLYVQTHGMIDESNNPLARTLDAALTKRLLRRAERVFYLTEKERSSLLEVGGTNLRVQHLINGVPQGGHYASPSKTEVLFLARLHPRKRALDFVRAAQHLAPIFPEVQWRLVGPDEGDGEEVRKLLAQSTADIHWEGPLSPEETEDRLARASIYCLPSLDEPFPMTVLEAMSIAVPVLVTESCGLSETITNSGAGRVTDGTLSGLIYHLEHMLDDPGRLRNMGQRARTTVDQHFTMRNIADSLVSAYRSSQSR